MEQIYRFDPALLFESAALEDADESESMQDAPGYTSSELAQLKTAENLCQQAATNNHGILPASCGRSILGFLKHKGVVQELESGAYALAHDCLEIGLSCASPVLEREMRLGKSTLELEHEFSLQGWSLVKNDKEASISSRCLVRNNYSTYYNLILHFASTLQVLEESGEFHHKQSHGYFQAIEASIICHADRDETFYVPPYQKAEFYAALIKYIEGISVAEFQGKIAKRG